MNKDNKITLALSLSEEIIKNIESKEIPIEDVCLKVGRLAKILDDDKNIENFINFSVKIKELKSQIETLRVVAPLAPKKIIGAMQNMRNLEEAIQRIKTAVHAYVFNKYYEMKFSSIPDNIFEKTRIRVDRMLSEMVPGAVKKFLSVYENLKYSNVEDWSNAVHSCRRILKDLADILYPPPDGLSEIDRAGKKIKVGPDEYINRLKIYVEERASSERFREIVGSHLAFLCDRLDSIYHASCKGSHKEISSIEEAERYIIYTYMVIGDILSL